MTDSAQPADLGDQAIPAASIDAEYAYLGAQPCPACGQGYRLARQTLVHHADRPYDILDIRCTGCGAERRLVFDISSFFGHRP